MQQHGSEYFARTPPSRWSKGHNLTFSEQGHVVYQVKGNKECSSLVANILTGDPH